MPALSFARRIWEEERLKRIFALCLALLMLFGCSTESWTAAGDLEVHFLDVGQADSILLRCGGEAMLIDGGNVADSSLVVSYLLERGIEELDYVVSTHPHEDHVGGLPGVLAVFPVAQVYSPTTTYTSKCFDDFMRYVDQQGLRAECPEPGTELLLGTCRITFLGPVTSYAGINDTSLVLRADFGDTAFLFTGDMEKTAEAGLLDSGADLKADVLKVGHHGSSTSTSTDFLQQVAPEYAVISCGRGNEYGHPHREVLSRLQNANVTIYRTDMSGTVVAYSDGHQIVFQVEERATSFPPADAEDSYIGNRNSHKFHLPTCSGLPSAENQVIFDSYVQAVEAGYTPCQRCLG